MLYFQPHRPPTILVAKNGPWDLSSGTILQHMATPLSVSVNALHDEQVISSLSHCTSRALGGAREVDTGDRWTQRHSAPPRDRQGTSRYEF